MDTNKIRVSLSDGFSLVAEINPDEAYKEIFVYLEAPDGSIHQDLAIVGEEYTYDDKGVVPVSGKYSVKVYSDSNNEDFTHDFVVDKWSWTENL